MFLLLIESSLGCWEKAEYIAEAVVIVGVIGEALTEFTNLLGAPESRESKRWAKISTIILIVGLAFGLVSLGRTNALSGQLVADSIREAGDAKTSAQGAATASSMAVKDASDARAEADVVQKKARAISNELTRLQGDARELDARAAKTKSDLINLAVCNAPRVITQWFITTRSSKTSYVDPMTPMAGQTVFIQTLPDSEARRASLNIARTLVDAKWDIRPIQIVDSLPDGVSIEPSGPPRHSREDRTDMSEMSELGAYWHASDVVRKLVEFLHSYNWEASRDWWTDAQGKIVRDPVIAPVGSIRIQVGLYPAAIYVNPPGRKELAAHLEEERRLREQARAELERKMESQLSTLTPEIRNKIQEMHKIDEAEANDAMGYGPCQILTPTF